MPSALKRYLPQLGVQRWGPILTLACGVIKIMADALLCGLKILKQE